MTGALGISFSADLEGSDLDALKVLPVANSPSDTFLSLQAASVIDALGNLGVESTIGVSPVVPDTSRPELDTFDFDLDRGLLILNFND